MLRILKPAIVVLLASGFLAGCMDPTISKDTFAFGVESSGSWTLRIDAEYSDGWKSHLVPGEGSKELTLANIIGTDQKQWTASFDKDMNNVRVVYEGDKVYDGSIDEDEKITWPY